MKLADRIRMHGRERYAAPARQRKDKRFSIRAGDVVHELKISGYAPAVCSALKTREFLRENNVRLVGRSGPESGLSTTVTYTYEFVDVPTPGPATQPSAEDTWNSMRGALKEVFAAYGGGEAYLRAERENFYGNKEGK
jgi:hypothetical protein